MRTTGVLSTLLAICAGCAASPPAEPPAELVLSPPAQWDRVLPRAVPVAPTPTPVPSPSPAAATSGGPSPAAVLADSATTQAAANRYVAWSKSRPENINRLTVLNAKVNSAIRRMQTYLRDGHYDPARVLVARQAVDALRDFLAEKGD